MALRDRLRRLERTAREELVRIPLEGGSVARFPPAALEEAFLTALARELGQDVPDHPLSRAARGSSEDLWRQSFFALGEAVREAPPGDLSE